MPSTQKCMFIGLEINTFGNPTGQRRVTVLPTTPSGESIVLTEHKCQYSPYDDDETDIRNRLEMIKEIISKASSQEEVKTAVASGVQIVFMTPEFLFRGVTGAYSFKYYDDLVKELTKIAVGYKGWLFVFGSLLVQWQDSPNKTIIQNTVLVVEGGTDANSNRVITKEFKSHIDFIGYAHPNGLGVFYSNVANTNELMHDDVQHPDAGPTGVGKEEQVHPYDGRGIFTNSKGITFGVEICKDHLEGRLAKSPVSLNSPLVQVQLVPSAGAYIEPSSVISCGDGLVFNCDSNSLPSTRLKRVDPTFVPYAGGSASFTSSDETYRDVPVSKLPNVMEISWGRGAKLKIYETVNVPSETLRQ